MTHEEFRNTKFFASLSGLRALAVILVIIVHFGDKTGPGLTGWLGVQIFFVLSGFLITTLLLRENDSEEGVSLGNFYIRRVFRIAPIYYLALACTVWQSYRFGGEVWEKFQSALPYYLFLLNEQTFINLTGPVPWQLSWTMGIEWKFYLVWPVLLFVLARNSLGRFAIVAVLVVILNRLWYVQWLTPYHYTVLIEGSLLAMVMHDRRGFGIVRWIMNPVTAFVVFVSFAVFQTQVFRLVPLMSNAGLGNLYGLAVVCLIPAILGPGLPQRILSSTPFVFLGERSYSLYLFQMVIAQACTKLTGWRTPGWIYIAMIVVLGAVVTDLLHRYLEKPMIALGRRVISALSQRKLMDVKG